MNPEETVAAEIMLLEAEQQIEQLAKEVLKLEAENQRLKRIIDDISKSFTTRI
jgi:hypothetical protein